MNQKVRMLGLLAAIAVSSSSIGAVVDTDMPLNVSWNGSPPTPDGRTWVNVLFRDFNGAGPLGNYEWSGGKAEPPRVERAARYMADKGYERRYDIGSRC